MRKISVLFILATALNIAGFGQVAAWDFTGQNNVPTVAATTFDQNLVATGGSNNITRGPGASPSTGANSFRTTGFKNEGISVANNDYFQITLTANIGYKLSVSTIDARFAGTASFNTSPGVTSQFAYSLDGIVFTLIGSPVTSTALTMAQINLTSVSALQNISAGKTVTIRYYASGQTATGGWGYNSTAAGQNGLAIGGTVDIVVLLNPPVLISDVTNNDVDHSLDITFTDDAAWRAAVSSVKEGGTTLTPATDYTLNAGDLQLIPSGGNPLLTSSGAKTITIEASGYNNASIVQQINAGVPVSTNSTSVLDFPLALNSTGNVTATAKDQYSNVVQGYTFTYDAVVTNNDPYTNENYTVDASALTSTQTGVSLTGTTNSGGVATFGITIPAIVDPNDGISVQLMLNDGITNIGEAFSFSKIPSQVTLTGLDPGTTGFAASSPDNILYRIRLDVQNDAATLNQLMFTTNGSYLAGDIAANGFKLRYSANSTLETATDPVIGQLSSGSTGTGEILKFTGLAQSFSPGTAYLFIVADISGNAAAGNMISGGSVQNSDLSFSGTTTFGICSFTPPFLHTILYVPFPGEIVISQFSAGYNGADDEYVELLNKTNKSFDLSALKVESESAAGIAGSAGGSLTGILGPYQYWLLSPNPSVTAGQTQALPRDGSISPGFIYPGGQLALLLKNSPFVKIDGLAYGTITVNNLGEGLSAVQPPLDGGLTRTIEGTDNNNNTSDFTAVQPANIYLRNSSSLNISGNYTIPGTSWSDIIISGFSPGVSLSGNTTLSKNLTLISGNLTVGSSQTLSVGGITTLTGNECLLLESDASGTASFTDNGISGSGTANIERYLVNTGDSLADQWHIVSSPVSDATSSIFLSEYLKLYNESNHAFEQITSLSEPLLPVKGYFVWVNATSTKVFTGTLNTGDQSIGVTRTHNSGTNAMDGWNMVGNPYPSTLDLTSCMSSWVHMDPAAWFWDPAAGNYMVYPSGAVPNPNPVGYGTHSPIVPPEQGFFVHCNDTAAHPTLPGSGTVSFTNADRTNSHEPFLKSSEVIPDLFKLKVQSSENNYFDALSVYFDPSRSNGYEPGYDALKFRGNEDAPQISTLINNVAVSVNSQVFDKKNIPVPMTFSAGIPGNYTFTASNLQSFEEATSIHLEDLKLNFTQDFKVNPVYVFYYDTTDDKERFVLHFDDPTQGVGGIKPISTLQIYSFGNRICIKSSDGIPFGGSAFIYDLIGKELGQFSLSPQAENWLSPNVAEGYYLVTVVTRKGVLNEKVFLK